MIEWKRARKDETDLFKRRTWCSRCDDYRVEELVSKLGLSTRFLAFGPNSTLLGRHRRRRLAEKTCEKHKFSKKS